MKYNNDKNNSNNHTNTSIPINIKSSAGFKLTNTTWVKKPNFSSLTTPEDAPPQTPSDDSDKFYSGDDNTLNQSLSISLASHPSSILNKYHSSTTDIYSESTPKITSISQLPTLSNTISTSNSNKTSVTFVVEPKIKLKTNSSDLFQRPFPITSNSYPSMTISRSNLNPGPAWTSDDFIKQKRLGSGQFGTVFQAIEKQSKRCVALKMISKSKILRHNSLSQLRREVEIHCHLKHPNIARLYGYFQNETHVFLVAEFAPLGDLFSHFKEVQKFNERTTANYIYQLANALAYIHRKDVIHRDIKPENIIRFPGEVIKLTDFGWAVHSPTLRRATTCGTLDYMAPEIVQYSEYDHTLDLWGLGVLCYELLTGNPPFEHISRKSTQSRIVNVDLQLPPNISSEAKDLIQKLLKYQPEERISIQQVLNHPWILSNAKFKI